MCAGMPWAAPACPPPPPPPSSFHTLHESGSVCLSFEHRADAAAGWKLRPVSVTLEVFRQEDGAAQRESANFLRGSHGCAPFPGPERNGLSCLERNPRTGLPWFVGLTRLPVSTGPDRRVFPAKVGGVSLAPSLHPPGKTTKQRLTWDVRVDSFLRSPGEEAMSGGMFWKGRNGPCVCLPKQHPDASPFRALNAWQVFPGKS